MSPPRTIRALALATLGLGGAFLLSLGLYTADLATSPQLPLLEELQVVVLPEVVAESGQEEEREEQLRKLLEDSSEIELQPPVFLQKVYTVQVVEEDDRVEPRVVARPGAISQGEGGLTYSLREVGMKMRTGQRGPAKRFSISPTTGAISVLVPLERDGPHGHLLHRLTVTATERGGLGLSAEAVVEIQVEDINDNSPVFARKNYSAVLSGEVVAGTEVITVTATDMDDPDTEDNGRLTYSLGEEQAEFTIEPESGVVRSTVCCLAPGSEYRLEVVATDGGGQTDSAMLHVTVLELAGGQGEFGRLMASRLEVLQAHCRSQDRWPGINSNVMYVLEEVKLVWCPVYKAASTNWMYNLLYLAGRSREEVEATKARHPHQPNDAAREVAPPVSYSRVLEVAGEQGATGLLIVRHPFERLVSAFRDKLEQCHGPTNCTLQNNWYYKTYGKRMVSEFRRKATRVLGKEFFSESNNFGAPIPVSRTWRSKDLPSWWEFVQSLLSTSPSSYDEHWKPVSSYCSPCSFPYTRILHSETIQDEEQELAKELGAAGKIRPKHENDNTGGRNGSGILERYFGFLSDRDITALYDIYKDDFLMFGYSFSFRGINLNI